MGPDGGIDPELLRQAQAVLAGSGDPAGGRTRESVAMSAQQAKLELNRAAWLMRRGQDSEAMAAYRRLASRAAEGHVPPAIGVDAAVVWAEYAFGRADWDEVILAERAAAAHLEALRSGPADLFSRDGYSALRGQLAARAAFAWTKKGNMDSARAVLEAGRNSMLAAFRGVTGGTAPYPGRPAVFLIATEAGGLALPSRKGKDDGDGAPVWLDQLGGTAFVDRLKAYGGALDAVRRSSVFGMATWRAEVAAMVAYLGQALAPLFAARPGADLALVPAGALALLPVAAAALTSAEPQRGVTILPSPRLGGTVRTEIPDRVLAVVDPVLPATRWEIPGVKAFFPDSATCRADASAADVVAAIQAGGVIHVACHASADVGRPLRSAIELPSGDRLTVAQIFDARLSADATVVLSACESGLAGAYVVDETLSLSTALLAAGCGGVLSTLWRVEDISTALLVLRFYWHWRREHRLAPLALALAQHWQRTSADRDKCRFVEDTLVAARILDQAEARALAGVVREVSDSPAGNSYVEPYYWAGFCFSGQ